MRKFALSLDRFTWMGLILAFVFMGFHLFSAPAPLILEVPLLGITMVVFAFLNFFVLVLILPASRGDNIQIVDFIMKTLISGLLVILSFAYLFESTGLKLPSGEIMSSSVAIYFSTVTFQHWALAKFHRCPHRVIGRQPRLSWGIYI